MALGIAPSGAVVAAGATSRLGTGWAGPNRDARVAAPQEMTKEGKAGSAPHIFSCYPTRWDNSEQEGRAVTKILDEVLAANAKYSENFGEKANLPLPPSRHFAILTWMPALIRQNTPV